ncbi:hypothetical protein VTK73DRAFT_1879 [Phialemonium thermophilum]|uniref:Uncharacterized protein n=1 Tax=Phialemonium thermophilum TaxID=223376 RepID=A0ABR3VSV0_9PEZI
MAEGVGDPGRHRDAARLPRSLARRLLGLAGSSSPAARHRCRASHTHVRRCRLPVPLGARRHHHARAAGQLAPPRGGAHAGRCLLPVLCLASQRGPASPLREDAGSGVLAGGRPAAVAVRAARQRAGDRSRLHRPRPGHPIQHRDAVRRPLRRGLAAPGRAGAGQGRLPDQQHRRRAANPRTCWLPGRDSSPDPNTLTSNTPPASHGPHAAESRQGPTW